MAQKQYVYFYGVSKELTEGDSSMKAILGGKGSNLAEMANANLPVPPGMTISTEACAYYSKTGGKYPPVMEKQLKAQLKKLEINTGKKLGDPKDPLLVSVRSGAAVSMPGMMDTVLNLGLSDKVVEGLARNTDNPRFAFDAYRRFIDMFGDVVMGVDHDHFEHAIGALKTKRGVALDVDLSADDLRELVDSYKSIFKATSQ